MPSPLKQPTSNWFFCFSAVLFATLTVICMILFNASHKPQPVRRPLLSAAESDAMLEIRQARASGDYISEMQYTQKLLARRK